MGNNEGKKMLNVVTPLNQVSFSKVSIENYNLIGYQCVVQIVPMGRSSVLLFFHVV